MLSNTMSEPTDDPSGAAEPEPPTEGAGWTALLQTGAELGEDVWLEQRVFELLGRWAATAEVPTVVTHLGAQSRRHGWHRQIFFDRLPELSVFDADAAVRSPGSGTSVLFDSLDALATAPDPVRLAVHNRVLLPALVVRYRNRLLSSSPVADASLQRWLRIVIADDLDEWADGEALLAELVDHDEHAAVAAAQLEVTGALLRSAHLTA